MLCDIWPILHDVCNIRVIRYELHNKAGVAETHEVIMMLRENRLAKHDIASLYMVSFYCFVTKHAQKGLVQPQAWSVGNASAAPCRGGRRACRSDTLAASQAFERMHILCRRGQVELQPHIPHLVSSS